MAPRHEERDWLRTVSMLVLAATAGAGALYFTRSVMIPFVLALFLVIMAAPIMDWMMARFRAPRVVAAGTTMTLVLVIIALFGLMLVVSVQRVVATAGQYSDNFATLVGGSLEIAADWGVQTDRDSLLAELRSHMSTIVAASFGTAMSIISNTFLILVFTFFLLAGRVPLAGRSTFYAQIDRRIRKYIGIKVALSAVTGVLTWFVLALIGLDLAYIFGLLAFFLNFIPNVGSLLAVALPFPLAVAQFDSVWPIILAVALPSAIQVVIGNGLETKMLGEGLELHPVAVLMALAFWGLLWGVMGMILAAPLTAAIRIVLLNFETVRPLGELLGGRLPELSGASEAAETAPERPARRKARSVARPKTASAPAKGRSRNAKQT